MAQPFPSDDPYFGRGFEPIRMESDNADLAIVGAVPAELRGTLYRIGPNPQFAPRGRYNPLLGDGMIHAFHIDNARVAYRNRWVRTQQWTLERAAGRALFGTSGNPCDADPSVAGMRTDGVANTNLIWHGGKLLALEESHAPIAIDPLTLETLGVWTFDGNLRTNMTAHPKIDPESGDMLFFANVPNGNLNGEIAFYVADSAGALIRSEKIQGPFAALVHDFAVTKDFVIFAICPVTVSIERARAGGPAIAWEPERQTHVGVLRRNGSEAVRWFIGPPCMAWHTMNAFNDADIIVVDVCQQHGPAFPSPHGTYPASPVLRQYLTRWTLDWSSPGGFTASRLNDVVCEYPRIDERRAGLSYRHGYLACDGGPGTDDLFHRGIAHVDHQTRRMSIYHAGPRCSVAEPVFVPRAADAAEGEGYLLSTLFDEDHNASHLAIFDAQDVARGPVARAFLDHRVPGGFHGIWRPTSEPAAAVA